VKQNRDVSDILNKNRTKLSQFLDNEVIEDIEREFYQDIENRDIKLIYNSYVENIELLFAFIMRYIDDSIDRANSFTLMIQNFRRELNSAVGEYQKEQIILDYAYQLNPSRQALQADKRALKRYFDEDALVERITAKISYIQRSIITALDRLIIIFHELIESGQNPINLWDKFHLNIFFLRLLNYKEQNRVKQYSFKLFTTVISYIDIDNLRKILDRELFTLLYDTAISPREDVWSQRDAISVILRFDISYFLDIAYYHFKQNHTADSIFVRHQIAKLCSYNSHKDKRLAHFILSTILKDPSPYVRQALSKTIFDMQDEILYPIREELILNDNENSVRAYGLLQILRDDINHRDRLDIFRLIFKILESDSDIFVVKTALFAIQELSTGEASKYLKDKSILKEAYKNIEIFLQDDTKPPILKRYASITKEHIWISFDEGRSSIYRNLKLFIPTIKETKSKKIPKELLILEDKELYRVLSTVVQRDFSIQLKRGLFGYYIYRGDIFKRRLWRVIFEFMHPSPDKRQAFLHTIARVYDYPLIFPSTIMAEQAPTKVPGEPYLIPEEDSSRPFIPLLDHFYSLLHQPTLRLRDYKIYTNEGITTISPPKSIFQRVRARFKLYFDFAQIARVRNWRETDKESPDTYLKILKDLGFGIKFSPYIKGDKSVERFFPIFIPIPFVTPEIEESINSYFMSIYQNTIFDLLAFVIAIFGIFFIRHLIISHKIKKARESIPLSIGGWGTRGKSGTERVKAALFNGLGYRVFSKTTGNEAMFLHAESFQPMIETYLYRPYDKATIWEQANVVRLASKLDVDIFLWECMGLTPAYVEILQKRWMQDDIATITNTYPDHENLQGPAGVNIPQVMTNFIPEHSILVSTEEVMSPILRDYSNIVGTKYHQEGWLRAGLLAPDILSRFPYEEHPNNIALVLGVADELDIDEDEALKMMADFIVPDLGVLKAYPEAKIGSKRLLFINGMSANERFGALGNWKRMGLGDIDDIKNPDIMVTAVINNRADRVARSRVFASMVIEDIVADMFVLIGSNLSGFHSYMQESWSIYKESIILEDNQQINKQILNYAKRYRVIRDENQLKNNLKLMLESSNIDNKQIQEALKHFKDIEYLKQQFDKNNEVVIFYEKYLTQYQKLQNLLQSSNSLKEKEEELREFLWWLIESRVVTVWNYYATGDAVIMEIYNNTPPGKLNKIIGMQNIKGTGLDFAYQWVAWDSVYKICMQLQSSSDIKQLIDRLASFDRYNFLSIELVTQTIESLKNSPKTQNDYIQTQIRHIESILEKSKEILQNLSSSDDEGSKGLKDIIKDKLIEWLEKLLDAGDAVKRRKEADRIYEDLSNFHISHKRASIELKKIVMRQKGGWLKKKLS